LDFALFLLFRVKKYPCKAEFSGFEYYFYRASGEMLFREIVAERV